MSIRGAQEAAHNVNAAMDRIRRATQDVREHGINDKLITEALQQSMRWLTTLEDELTLYQQEQQIDAENPALDLSGLPEGFTAERLPGEEGRPGAVVYRRHDDPTPVAVARFARNGDQWDYQYLAPRTSSTTRREASFEAAHARIAGWLTRTQAK